jgi:hypothetical protein
MTIVILPRPYERMIAVILHSLLKIYGGCHITPSLRIYKRGAVVGEIVNQNGIIFQFI